VQPQPRSSSSAPPTYGRQLHLVDKVHAKRNKTPPTTCSPVEPPDVDVEFEKFLVGRRRNDRRVRALVPRMNPDSAELSAAIEAAPGGLIHNQRLVARRGGAAPGQHQAEDQAGLASWGLTLAVEAQPDPASRS